ncbi:MAG: SURF1 family protein [Bdellovibrionota bacterium]
MGNNRRFTFSWQITTFGLLAVIFTARLSYWQWERYLAKEALLSELAERLEKPVIPLEQLLPISMSEANSILHRRVLVEGTFDFAHEFVKRNRKDEEDGPGVHVITPLKLDASEGHILVNRGYVPFSVKSAEARKQFQHPTHARFEALVKTTETARSFFSPQDKPKSPDEQWIDERYRVDIDAIQEQLPYSILPIHLEIIRSLDSTMVSDALVKNSETRNEIFYLGENLNKVTTGSINPNRDYPVPAFSTVVPSATHLLYVYEWALISLGILLITIALQFRRPASKGDGENT